MGLASLRSPYIKSYIPEGAVVFDPFPGGKIFLLDDLETRMLDSLLAEGDSTDRGTEPDHEVLAFVNKSMAFLEFDSRRMIQGVGRVSPAACGTRSNPTIVFPVRAAFLCTRLCPRNCAYCVVPTQRCTDNGPIPRGRFPSPKELRELHEPGVRGFHIHGGEPLLVDGLAEFVAQLAGTGFVVSLSTRESRPLAFWRDMKSSGLALLQMSAEVAELAEKAAAIAAAVQAGLDVVMNIVMTRENVLSAARDPQALRTATAPGVREVRFERLMTALEDDFSALRPTAAEVSELTSATRGMAGVRIGQEPHPPSNTFCETDPAELVFADDGFVYPCDRLAYRERYKLHNWGRDGFQGSVAHEARRRLVCPFGRGR